jgi:hypothetical protein
MSQVQVEWIKNLTHKEIESGGKLHPHPHSQVKFCTCTCRSSAHQVPIGFIKNRSKINKLGFNRPTKEKNSAALTPISAKSEPNNSWVLLLSLTKKWPHTWTQSKRDLLSSITRIFYIKLISVAQQIISRCDLESRKKNLDRVWIDPPVKKNPHPSDPNPANANPNFFPKTRRNR